MAWHIKGDYVENCNCNILCPCITSSLEGPADNERCLVPLACHITDGAFDSVSLDGLNFVMVVDSPAVMGEGNWRVALYIDERADDAQREALGAILSGQHGGVPEMLAGVIGEMLGVKYVPIHYAIEGSKRRVEMPGILEMEVEGLTVPGEDAVMEISNVRHPMGTDLPIARSLQGKYNDPDYDFSFDNTGRNGHYREFAWQG